MKTKLEQYIKLPYSIKVVPDQSTEGFPCYMAYHPELSGCMSHGDTAQEAIFNLSGAKKLYIKTLLKKDQDVPLPKSFYVAIWEVTELKAEAPEKDLLNLIQAKVNPIESLEELNI
jgi:predicted RNase H-like HicB family nuclease